MVFRKRKANPVQSAEESLFHSSRFMHIPSQSLNAGRKWSADNCPRLRLDDGSNSHRATSSNGPSTFSPALNQSFDFGGIGEEDKFIKSALNKRRVKPPILPTFLKTSGVVATLILLVAFAHIPYLQIIVQRIPRKLFPIPMGYDARITLLENALFQLTRDGVARQDFAFRYSGGDVVPGLTTPIITKGAPLNDPFVALDDDLRQGRCWRIPGTSGQLGISLSDQIYVTHITIDHIPKELVSDIRNSPRNMTFWGVPEQGRATSAFSQRTSPPITNGRNFVVLASVTYDIYAKNNIQTFPVSDSYAAMNSSVKVVVAEIVDNWGSDSTCLYRVRVHGQCVNDLK